MVAIANEHWIALRALYEGVAANIELLSAVSGRSKVAIGKRAEKEAWVHARSGGDLRERLDRLADSLVRQIEAIRLESEASFDKTQIDKISALIRTVEKIVEITRGGGSAKESQTKRDAGMAEVLGRIDRRIIELAREYAKQLVAGKHNAPTG